MRQRKTRAVVSCLMAALLFGASTPISKALLGALGPFSLAGLLYLGGALAVGPVAFRGGSPELRRLPRERRLLAGAVLFGGGLGPVFLLLGLRAAPAASVALWLNLELVATTLLAWCLFGEHMGRRTWLAAGLVLLGGLVLASPGETGSLRAAALVAVACLCWGIDNNLTALVGGFTPAQTTFVKGLGAGSVNFGLGLAFEGGLPSAPAALGALGVGALAYGASIVLYIAGAQQLGASRSQLLFSTSPFLGVALSWAVFKEPVWIAQLAAAALMLAGISLMLTAKHEHEHSHEELFHTHTHRHDDGHHNHVHPGLPPSVRHTHAHHHEPIHHTHPHEPDMHHRHRHE